MKLEDTILGKRWLQWVILLIVAAVVIQFAGVFDITGAVKGIGLNQEPVPTLDDPVIPEQAVEAVEAETPAKVEKKVCPKFTIGKSDEPLVVLFRDADDPKTGIAGLAVEALDMGVDASDPLRMIRDNATTIASGEAQFIGNKIYAARQYQIVVRGNSDVYDYSTTIVTECLPTGVRGYTLEKYHLLKKVGSFKDLYPKTAGTTKALNTVTWNITSGNVTDTDGNVIKTGLGSTGVQYFELTGTYALQIGEAEAGKRIKRGTVTMESVEDKELQTGQLRSLYLIKETGTDFGISSVNLVSFMDTRTINLLGGFTDLTEGGVNGVNYMVASDSGLYALKMEFDADEVKKSLDAGKGVAFRVAADDLGGYREGDIITNHLKADPQIFILEMVA